MSYEGYSQFLCKKGHYWVVDSSNLEWLETKEYPKCPICKKSHVWENEVNLTNGSFNYDGKRIDGFRKLKLKKKNLMKCKCCGREQICKCSEYQIPKK
ncbi:MAG: hypothetical protein WC346_04505 [Methanogenium sp.]|jgi:hypothetical protein